LHGAMLALETSQKIAHCRDVLRDILGT